ncbi:MAG: hypothetical protein ACOC05_05535, partial [Oceanicaulis sp.]
MMSIDAARLRLLLGTGVLALLLAACGEREADAPEPAAEPTPAASPAPAPEIVGFSRAGLEAIDARLGALVESGDRSGVVMVLARDGVVRHVAEAGWADVEAQRPMTA